MIALSALPGWTWLVAWFIMLTYLSAPIWRRNNRRNRP